MSKPSIQITLVDRKGPCGCHRGHKVGDTFDFDTEIIMQVVFSGGTIVELPIPTHYGDEVCHVNGLRYAWDVMRTSLKGRLIRMGLFYDPKFFFPHTEVARKVSTFSFPSTGKAVADSVTYCVDSAGGRYDFDPSSWADTVFAGPVMLVHADSLLMASDSTMAVPQNHDADDSDAVRPVIQTRDERGTSPAMREPAVESVRASGTHEKMEVAAVRKK